MKQVKSECENLDGKIEEKEEDSNLMNKHLQNQLNALK